MLFLIVSILSLLSPGQTDQEQIRDFFERFAAQRDGIRSLEAPFVQRTVTPDEVVTSTGTVTYARPKRLIFRYDEPKLVYLLDGSRAYEYDPELFQVQIFDLSESPQAGAFYLGFEDNADRLLDANNVRLLIDDETGGVAVELTPKNPEDDEAFFERATLHLRKTDFLPSEIHIVNDSESQTRITLGDIVLNRALSPEELQIALPEGTDVIDNDEYMETVGPEGKLVPAVHDAAVTTP